MIRGDSFRPTIFPPPATAMGPTVGEHYDSASDHVGGLFVKGVGQRVASNESFDFESNSVGKGAPVAAVASRGNAPISNLQDCIASANRQTTSGRCVPTQNGITVSQIELGAFTAQAQQHAAQSQRPARVLPHIQKPTPRCSICWICFAHGLT